MTTPAFTEQDLTQLVLDIAGGDLDAITDWCRDHVATHADMWRLLYTLAYLDGWMLRRLPGGEGLAVIDTHGTDPSPRALAAARMVTYAHNQDLDTLTAICSSEVEHCTDDEITATFSELMAITSVLLRESRQHQKDGSTP